MAKLTLHDQLAHDPAQEKQAIEARLEQLDTLAAILPAGRTEHLAHLLTDDDVETLRHLANEGMGENSLRALTSDYSYLDAWCRAATGCPLPWPAPEALILKFIAHHLWDLDKKLVDPSHGMPEEVALVLDAQNMLRTPRTADGLRCPHAPATVDRRLASWATLHRWRGLPGAFGAADLRSALRLAKRAADRPRTRKSKKAVTVEVLRRLLQTCEGTEYAAPSLADLRDKALLLLGFASGGRRRSEIAGLRLDQIAFDDPVPENSDTPDGPRLSAAHILLKRTKTETAGDDNQVLLLGEPVDALTVWLQAANIKDGTVFRAIDRWGNLKSRGLTPQSVNAILKARCALAGMDPQEFSAHGLRSGFLTEAALRDIPLQDAMQQSRHKSVAQASAYYNDAGRLQRRSARILG